MGTRRRLLHISAVLLALGLALTAQAQLPASDKAPKIGEQAPDFTLPDANGKSVHLNDLLAAVKDKKAPAVLLVFYRGTW